MLHRRTTSSAPNGNAGGSTSSVGALPNLPNNVNNAYTPLRRPSQTLYNTPQGSATKARYKMPSPSPGMSQGQGQGQLYVNTTASGSYFPARNSIDLGDDYSRGGRTGADDSVRRIRYGLERMRMGLRDGLKLDRSLSLVWG